MTATTFLFTVDDRFQIAARGCVLVPGAPQAGPIVRVGDAIQLRTPDGRLIHSQVQGLEMISYLTVPEEVTVPILLPADLCKEDIPVGTEVFLVGAAEQ